MAKWSKHYSRKKINENHKIQGSQSWAIFKNNVKAFLPTVNIYQNSIRLLKDPLTSINCFSLSPVLTIGYLFLCGPRNAKPNGRKLWKSISENKWPNKFRQTRLVSCFYLLRTNILLIKMPQLYFTSSFSPMYRKTFYCYIKLNPRTETQIRNHAGKGILVTQQLSQLLIRWHFLNVYWLLRIPFLLFSSSLGAPES